MTPKYTEDKRLLGALDYIDEKFIAEVTESYKIFEPSDGKITAHRTLKISLRQFAALAACLILLSAAFPVTNYVVKAIKSFAAGWGSGTAEASSDILESTNCEDEYLYDDYLEPIEGLESLPESLIGEYPFNEINSAITSNSYLGCFSGYYVVFYKAYEFDGYGHDDVKVIDIGGYLFWGNHYAKMIAYKDDMVYELLDLYEEGIISDEQVNIVYLRYNEYMKYFNPESIVLDYTTINDSDLQLINEAWERKFGNGQIYAETVYDTRNNNMSEYCFGKINDVIVFRTNKTRSDNVNTFKIADVKFSYGSPTEFWVYKDGDLYSLNDAYNMGCLTKEELEGISMFNSEA